MLIFLKTTNVLRHVLMNTKAFDLREALERNEDSSEKIKIIEMQKFQD